VVLLANRRVVIDYALDRGIPARKVVIGGDAMLPHSLTLARELWRIDPDVFFIITYKKLFLAALGARLARVPRIIARIGLETDTPRTRKYRFALRRWIDGVVVIAERLVAPFAELDGFDPWKVTLIHNGVRQPVKRKPPGAVRRELGIPADAFVVGSVARLDRQKRLERIIETLRYFPRGAAAKLNAETRFSFDAMLDRWEAFLSGAPGAGREESTKTAAFSGRL
jgi:glycosyltransferase involved in cell wall biosynthesis